MLIAIEAAQSPRARIQRRVGRILIVVCQLSSAQLWARDVQVTSLSDLQAAIDAAAAGDRIELADGVYESAGAITIGAAGAKSQPIVITAKSVGGVEIRGVAGFTFRRPSAYVHLAGFKFTHDAGALELPAGTHHCRITRNVFELKVSGRSTYLTVSGDDHEIDHNTFRNKDTEGQMLHVLGPEGSAMAQHTWIHHNYFHDFANSRRNNSSALHIGHSARSLSAANSIVEYNLFLRTRGENEGAICNKSCDNTYRYNTIGEGCTELSLRHGNRCRVYGNFFIGTRGGLRFFGDEHKIYSNYFQGNRPAVQIGNGGGNVPPDALTSHDRPDGVQVAFNTLVDNEGNFAMSGRRRGLGATGLVVANNIIQGGRSPAAIDGPLPDAHWEGNLVWATEEKAGDMPADGFEIVDPLLQRQSDETYAPQSDSPAVGRASGSYEFVDVDVNGQTRGDRLDVGAHQLSAEPTRNRVLTPNDVGPDAP